MKSKAERLAEHLSDIDAYLAEDDEWNGEGTFPQVHTYCLMYDDKKTLVEVRIISWIDGYTVGWCADREQVYFSKDPKDFRPILAQEERDRDSLAVTIWGCIGGGKARSYEIADALIAAGYHK